MGIREFDRSASQHAKKRTSDPLAVARPRRPGRAVSLRIPSTTMADSVATSGVPWIVTPLAGTVSADSGSCGRSLLARFERFNVMLMVGRESFREIDSSCWETRAKKAVMPSSHEAGAKNTTTLIMRFVPRTT